MQSQLYTNSYQHASSFSWVNLYVFLPPGYQPIHYKSCQDLSIELEGKKKKTCKRLEMSIKKKCSYTCQPSRCYSRGRYVIIQSQHIYYISVMGAEPHYWPDTKLFPSIEQFIFPKIFPESSLFLLSYYGRLIMQRLSILLYWYFIF